MAEATAVADGDATAVADCDASARAVAAALAIAEAALNAYDAPKKTDEEVWAELEEVSRNAREHGTHPGTRAAIDRMMRKWRKFVEQAERFGCGFEPAVGPSVAFV